MIKYLAIIFLLIFSLGLSSQTDNFSDVSETFYLLAYVPEMLQDVYGKTDPCDDPILLKNVDEIRDMDEREFETYKIAVNKCENFKLSLIELKQIEVDVVLEVEKERRFNLVWGVVGFVAFLWLYDELTTCYVDCDNGMANIGACECR